MEIALRATNGRWAMAALGFALGVLSACGDQEGLVGAGGSSGSSAMTGSGGSSGLGGSSGVSGAAGSGGSAGSGGASGGRCAVGGCSSQLCGEVGDELTSTCEYTEEYACYRDARCERQGDGRCAWTETADLTECIAQARGTGTFRWYRSCGAPVCRPEEDAGTGAPACQAQQEGSSCSSGEAVCDPGLGCGVSLVCAASDPRLAPGGCPISRRRFKQDITALSAAERQRLSEELLRLPLVTYRYRDTDGTPQLGFVIEDVEPSYAVDAPRDQVNLYGYASLAVLALQEQQRTIAEQERRLSEQARRIEALERQLGAVESVLQRGVPSALRLDSPSRSRASHP
ncbi:MAG: tail fiber domain-containing protein [Deltaproteobacteria bacterium]